MKDIQNREDILLLMREFYNRLLADPAISYIFTDIAKIDLEAHLPHLTDFWEQTLFYTGGYKKNVLQLHLDLNAKEKLTDTHFKTWLNHFHKTIDKNFAGENAERMKSRAESIATVMKTKIFEHSQS
ncbi:group III truncated hemoglobin [Flavobacterium sp. D11R37]|uniref:group III truncated hemoglobin n=1 Tax=Flavobacterium coralii TaxID=2838017 RepID=UPI001CA79000|nr:group III truncated hemoglobin [Flavobacterium coralii]MBY8962847.1 group III truncated hemoglobin [Flavobacterium coralii]